MIEEHKARGQIVERISKFPLILDHNCVLPQTANEQPAMPERSKFITTRMDSSKDYMNAVRRFETAKKFPNYPNDILNR